jgi:hypothetical protein
MPGLRPVKPMRRASERLLLFAGTEGSDPSPSSGEAAANYTASQELLGRDTFTRHDRNDGRDRCVSAWKEDPAYKPANAVSCFANSPPKRGPDRRRFGPVMICPRRQGVKAKPGGVRVRRSRDMGSSYQSRLT